MTVVQDFATLSGYAATLTSNDQAADNQTPAAMEALDRLYNNRELWVDEWLQERPFGKTNRVNDPATRNRFAGWLTWKAEQGGVSTAVETPLPMIRNARVYQLLNALEVWRIIEADPTTSSTNVPTERALRPLNWLRRSRYMDRAPDIWNTADTHTHDGVRDALSTWKANTLGTAGVAQVVKQKRAKTHRNKAVMAAEALYRDNDVDEWMRFVQEVEKLHKQWEEETA